MDNPFIAAECSRAGVAQNLIDTHLPETYAQAGEDIIIEALLLAIASKAPATPGLFYLEIGANHPIQTSNTYLLYKKHSGHGVLFEADPDLIPILRQVRPRDQVVHAAVTDRREPTVMLNVSRAKELSTLDLQHARSFEPMLGEIASITGQISVPNLHIDDLLARYATQPIHYLSIDVEGGDLAIMRAINFERFRPRILTCEPSTHIYRTNPEDMLQVMAANGYAYIARTAVNMIFVDRRWL